MYSSKLKKKYHKKLPSSINRKKNKNNLLLTIFFGLLICIVFLTILINQKINKDTLGVMQKSIPSIYYGVATGSANMTYANLAQFETDAGKAVAIFHQYQGIDRSTCPWIYFPEENLGTTLMGFKYVREHGAIPMLTLMTNDTLDSVIQNKYDSCLKTIASGAAAWGKPFFLRLDHEMNYGWFSYGIGAPTPTPFGKPNTPKAFVAMWRHIHDIFTSEAKKLGKPNNVTWVWCPNVVDGESADLKKLYPGNDYVDWTCIDGYNFNKPWIFFANRYRETYNQITKNIAPSKPVMVGEYSSAEDPLRPAGKATWFTETLTEQVPNNFPKIRALVLWNNTQGSNDFRIESSPKAQQAFKRAIASNYYSSNNFSSIECSTGWCPIKPLQITNLTPTPTL